MASSVETIEVTDPAHPLDGLTLPCLGVTVKPRLGRVCVVRLHPGVERLIPVAATSLAPVRPPVSRCRLSLPAATKVLAVLASLVPDCHAARQEDSHAPLATTHRHPDDEAPGPAAPPAPADDRGASPTGTDARGDAHAAAGDLGRPEPGGAAGAAPHAAARRPGGAGC